MSSTAKAAEMDRQLLELSCVETAVPAHMMWMMAQSLYVTGYRLRPDIVRQLNVAAAAGLTALGEDLVAIQRAAKRVEDVAQKLLFRLSPDDPKHGFYACAMFCLYIAEEGYFADVQNVSVLTSIVLIDELKTAGGVEDYTFKERILLMEAKKLLSEAQREGLFRVQLISQKKENQPKAVLQ